MEPKGFGKADKADKAPPTSGCPRWVPRDSPYLLDRMNQFEANLQQNKKKLADLAKQLNPSSSNPSSSSTEKNSEQQVENIKQAMDTAQANATQLSDFSNELCVCCCMTVWPYPQGEDPPPEYFLNRPEPKDCRFCKDAEWDIIEVCHNVNGLAAHQWGKLFGKMNHCDCCLGKCPTCGKVPPFLNPS